MALSHLNVFKYSLWDTKRRRCKWQLPSKYNYTSLLNSILSSPTDTLQLTPNYRMKCHYWDFKCLQKNALFVASPAPHYLFEDKKDKLVYCWFAMHSMTRSHWLPYLVEGHREFRKLLWNWGFGSQMLLNRLWKHWAGTMWHFLVRSHSLEQMWPQPAMPRPRLGRGTLVHDQNLINLFQTPCFCFKPLRCDRAQRIWGGWH